MNSEEKIINELVNIFEKSSLSELEFSNRQLSLKLKKSLQDTINKNDSEKIEKREKQNKTESTIITSPLVGTFYRAPAPDAPPFVEKGKSVSKGDVLCIVEAMKMMNQIEAEFDCTISDILQENGAKVEFGTPLFEVIRD